MSIRYKDVIVPLDVPFYSRGKYILNYLNLTQRSGRLMLFAGDQKIEHLNGDFYGKGIHLNDADPEHLFRIASKAKIGVFATQLGLIARYGMDYKKVQYLVKLNSKSNIVKTEQKDPYSELIADVDDVIAFKKRTRLKILAVGYTLYLGSEYEALMMKTVADMIRKAHKHGLIFVLWIYPRGKAVLDEKDPHLIAGATGTGACLGADFVKVTYPEQKGKQSKEIFKEAIRAAGRTKVVCAGGGSTDVKAFLKTLHEQIYVSGAGGNATGRNVHQKGLKEAIAMCNAIYAMTVEDKTLEDAYAIYKLDKNA